MALMRLWHNLSFKDVFEALSSSESGLSNIEAQRRLEHFGPNELLSRGESLWKKIIEPFRSIFILILLAAASISFISGERLDGYIISAIIVINAGIYYSQRHATERVLRSLKKHSEQSVVVVRDGQEVTISSRLLVPGDVFILTEGLKVPADARLFHEDNLNSDESDLTGESL